MHEGVYTELVFKNGCGGLVDRAYHTQSSTALPQCSVQEYFWLGTTIILSREWLDNRSV